MYAAQALSVVGDQVARVAVALLVYRESESPLLAALTYALSYLTWIVGGPILSAIGDRVPRRTVMVNCDIARAVLVGLLALPGVPLPVLFGLLMLVSLLAPPFESARAATVPDILPGDMYVVGSSLTNITLQAGQVLGFAAGGALLGLVSIRGALAIDALTFAVSAVILHMWVRLRPVAVRDGEPEGLVRQSREGLRIVFTDPVLRSIVLLAWVGAAAAVIPEGLAVSYAADNGGGALATGLLTAAVPLGVVIGALVIGRFTVPSRRVQLMLPLAAAGTVPLMLTQLSPSLWVTGLLWVAAGVGTAYQLPANATFVAAVPPEARARAFGIAQSGLMALQGLGLAAAGSLAEWMEPAAVVSLAGALGLAGVALLALRWPHAAVARQGVLSADGAAANLSGPLAAPAPSAFDDASPMPYGAPGMSAAPPLRAASGAPSATVVLEAGGQGATGQAGANGKAGATGPAMGDTPSSPQEPVRPAAPTAAPTTAAPTTTAPTTTPTVQRRRTWRIQLLTTLLVAVTAVGCATWLTGESWDARPLHLAWWALVPVFVLTESYVVHFEVRRQARSVSLAQLPLVLGLFFVGPLGLVVARVLGSMVALVAVRRQPPLKWLLNCGVVGVEVTVAVLVFQLLAPAGAELGPQSWGAALAGTLAAELVSSLVVAVAIGIYEGRLDWRDALTPFAFASGVAVVNTSLALIAVTSLWYDLSTAWALALVVGLSVVAFRAYSRLVERHALLGRLYSFSRELGPVGPDLEHLGPTLDQMRELLHADRLELAFVRPGAPSATVVSVGGDHAARTDVLSDLAELDELGRQVLASGRSTLQPRPYGRPWGPHRRGGAAVLDRMAAPLGETSEVLGVLRAESRSGEVRGFDDADLRLLETVATQLGAALEKGRLIEGLHRAATRDLLTGLPNLESTRASLDELLLRAPSEGVLVLVVDLDRFQDVNDNFGHDAGDTVLREVARRLETSAPPGATVGRVGGDQFAVVLPGGGGGDLAALAAVGVKSQVEGPVPFPPFTADIRVSIGLARSPLHGTDATTLLRRAEMAMYETKGSGRGVTEWDPSHERDGSRRLAVVVALREALARDELHVAFQPKLALEDGGVRPVGLEALARWHHGGLGVVHPDEFVPLAESSGLISALTTAVLRRALAACGAWHRLGMPVGVSVNLSPRSLLDPLLLAQVGALVEVSGLEAHWLTLELTENCVMDNPAQSMGVLRQLRTLGVRLSIDDFGTGYSSLSYVKGLPVHEVKVDQGFVTDIETDVASWAVVRAVVELAHSLALTVVAEGVENVGQALALQRLGVDEVQGYVYSEPLHFDDATAWLSERLPGG